MKLLKNEEKLVNFIRFGAISFTIVLSLFITTVFINQKSNELEDDIKRIEENFINQNKVMVENLVNKIYNLIKLENDFEKIDFDDELKEEIYQAHDIVTKIYNENINKPNYSKEQTIESIKDTLRGMRFYKGKGYLFVYELDGTNILNAEFPNLEGKNLWNYQDLHGTPILQDMNKILSTKDETFYNWYWHKDKNDTKEYKKIGFFKKFEPYNIFIGTGYYQDDYDIQTKTRILEKLNSFELKRPEHIFVYDLNGVCLVNPKKELIGVNRYNVKNEKGEYILRDTLDFTVKNREGFIRYHSSVMLNEKIKSNDKISFVKLYEDWNWVIGSGFYLEELNNQIEQKRLTLMQSNEKALKIITIISIFGTIIMIIISFYLSNFISNSFIEYKKNIKSEMQKTYEKEKLLVQQSKMATMGEMIGSIAHQWKQPLSVISMSSGMLRLDKESEKGFFSKDEIEEALTSIDDSVHNLTQTIDDFRNFFNPNKNRTLFKISEAFEDTLKLISSQLRNNNIQIIKNISDVELYGSKNELLQTLINLIKNAKEELVKKELGQKRYIFINVYQKDNNVVIKIKDNANGIPTNIIDNIFKAYFTTKEKEGGSGIGLYMSKQIIEGSMKGKIDVENVEYQYENQSYIGAEFTIVVPMDLRVR